MEASDHVYLDMSGNGGLSWTNSFGDITDGTDTGYVASGAIDVSAYKANLALRFRSAYTYGSNTAWQNDGVYIDNVLLTCSAQVVTPVTQAAACPAQPGDRGRRLHARPRAGHAGDFRCGGGCSPHRGQSSVDNTAAVTSDLQTNPHYASTTNPLPLAGVGNYIWYDSDGDGVQDVGEPGVSG